MAKRKEVVVAVDIEKTGDRLMADRIISVGLQIGYPENPEPTGEDDPTPLKGWLIESKRFNFQVEWFDVEKKTYGDFEPRCVDEFWSRQSETIIADCKENALPPKEGWASFRGYIDSLEEKYPYQQYKLRFLSDNPSFDIAGIDCELERYDHPILRRTKGAFPWPHNYRSVVAADDCLFILPKNSQDYIMKDIKEVVQHDHNPLNDAYCIYLYYVYACKSLKAMEVNG